ncbi:hypothetical protein [Microlunatus soli]|uniref:Uncharacterized protein n=1 Tax=Microlunatus soli TaxID=630515 RepID=A0A1H1ZWZ4_9ACTN|nr:hypothetical protein [Microlunatus soli]SDT37766.1 hypothetical protein SAMN04489812_5487 [Microlunatus soli]
MRLYLSSQQLGRAPEELIKLFNGRTRIAVIANGGYLDDLGNQHGRLVARGVSSDWPADTKVIIARM